MIITGVAAAAAILSGRKRKRHTFESNPALRKRHCSKLLRRLKETLDELSTRVGLQVDIIRIRCTILLCKHAVCDTKRGEKTPNLQSKPAKTWVFLAQGLLPRDIIIEQLLYCKHSFTLLTFIFHVEIYDRQMAIFKGL